jgi:hypothetical protein
MYAHMRILISCAITAFSCSAWADKVPEGSSYSRQLSSAIRQLSPTASILRAADVNTKSCESTPESPTLVRADLNGDGREDVAALLTTSVSEDIRVIDGQQYRKSSLRLVFFLNDGKGSYSTRTVRSFVAFVPIGAYISVQAPGTIRPLGSETGVTLSNPGVVLTFCEQSEAVYAVVDGHIRMFVLSD